MDGDGRGRRGRGWGFMYGGREMIVPVVIMSACGL